jgi:hypothetical protein
MPRLRNGRGKVLHPSPRHGPDRVAPSGQKVFASEGRCWEVVALKDRREGEASGREERLDAARGRREGREAGQGKGARRKSGGRREDTSGVGWMGRTSAPSCLRVFCFSLDMISGMQHTSLYPRALHTCASPIPVLPDVASVMVPPGLISPLSSASCSRQSLSPESLNARCGLRKYGAMKTSSWSYEDELERRPVLHRASRVHVLRFRKDLAAGLLAQLVQADQRGVANSLLKPVPNSRHRKWVPSTETGRPSLERVHL